MPLKPKSAHNVKAPLLTSLGLKLLFRDADLGNLEIRYTKGLIIRERGFVDASKRGGGMVTSHRFAIFSSRFIDTDKAEDKTKWGLCILPRDSHFKVLDICKREGKTQIILLHLPDEWEQFADLIAKIEQQGVAYARKGFDKYLVATPIPELATKEWLERCKFPLGMTEKGEYFPLAD